MAKRKEGYWSYCGQEDLVGAVVTKVEYDEFYLEKDGVKFKLVQERDFGGTCMCYNDCGCCTCGAQDYYTMRAQRWYD